MKTQRRIRKPTGLEKSPNRGVCPLCEKAFLRSHLESRIKQEPPKTRRQIIKAIKDEVPSWRLHDGACKRCWESFGGVVRVVNFVKKLKFPGQAR